MKPRVWRLRRRVDLSKASPYLVPDRCERCVRGLRYVDLLENMEGERLAVGRQCSRRLREGSADA